MEFISNNDYINPYNKSGNTTRLLRVLQTNSNGSSSSEVPPLVSGNTIDFNIYIMDQEGEVYKADSSSKAIINNDDQKNDKIILLNNEVIAKEGIYQFRDVKFIAPPGSSAPLRLSISGLETFGNSLEFVEQPVKIEANARKCVAGEELTADNKCQVCPPGTFQYFTPETITPCQQCPKDATCMGKTTVAPQPGYWRSSNTSSNFIKCPNFEVCLGGDSENPNGKCMEGYQGIICGDCAPNYSKTKQFTCKQCPDFTRNLIQTVLLLFASVIIVSFLVRSTLNSADKQKPVYSVYLKIMTNHFQIIGAISNIDFQWPKAIEQFQEQQSTVSTAGSQVFSFDCFLMGSDGKDEGTPVFFQKLIMYAMLPLIMSVVCFLFWFIVSKIQKKTIAEFKSKFISTLIVVLFLVHPDIAKAMFLTFNCLEVDGVFRMKENVSSVCYKEQHLFFISALVFPAIGLWVFGIPIFALIILVKNKRALILMAKKEITQSEQEEIVQVKMKYGFLFSGYGGKTFFWEVIIMMRKILIIMTSVFLSTVSSESQVLVVIFIIVLSMFLQIKFAPYYTDTLNKMENYSLQVAAVTIYTGMYYVTGRHYNYMDNQGVSWFFLCCIILPNLVFLVYWVYNMRIEVVKEVYRRNLNPKIFMILACQSPQSFYNRHMKTEEEFIKLNAQKIICDDTVTTPQQLLDDNKFTPEAPYENSQQEELNKNSSNSSSIKQREHNDQNNNQDANTFRRQRQRRGGQWEQIPSTARSFKVHPESVVNTARLTNYMETNFIDENKDIQLEMPGYNTPPESSGEVKNFHFDNKTMIGKINKAKQSQSKRRERFGQPNGTVSVSPQLLIEEESKTPAGITSREHLYQIQEADLEEIDITIDQDYNTKRPMNRKPKTDRSLNRDHSFPETSIEDSPEHLVSSKFPISRQLQTHTAKELKSALMFPVSNLKPLSSARRSPLINEIGTSKSEQKPNQFNDTGMTFNKKLKKSSSRSPDDKKRKHKSKSPNDEEKKDKKKKKSKSRLRDRK